MKPSERRKAMKAEMAQRAQEAYNNKDDSGKFKPYLVRGRLGKVQMWKCSEDEHFLNFIPFVAGEHNPNVAPGKMAYALDVFVHRKVGVNEDSYLCMSRTYGKPCSICEHQAEVRKQDEYDDKFAKSLNPTRRVIYNIECLDSEKQTQMGIQIFDVSHYLFEKELAELAKKPRGGGYVLFSDPDEGKTVFFRKSGSGATNTEYKAFAFEDRDEPISDELLDSAVCLDSLLYIPTYEEVYAAFHGTVEEEPTEEKEFECPGTVLIIMAKWMPATLALTPIVVQMSLVKVKKVKKKVGLKAKKKMICLQLSLKSPSLASVGVPLLNRKPLLLKSLLKSLLLILPQLRVVAFVAVRGHRCHS